MNADDSDRDILSERFVEAPRDRVWKAFSDPEALAIWWGPAGFTNIFHTFDLRPGAEWRFTMRGPDGSEHPMIKVFVEVESPSRIVFDHPDPVHGHRMFIDLLNCGTGTEVSWRMRFDSLAEAERVRPLVEGANQQNFDRLAEYLRAPLECRAP